MSEPLRTADRSHADQLRKLVSTYCSDERPAGAKLFEVHSFLLIEVIRDAPVDIRDSPGCYVIYDDRGEMRYVGMSQEAIGYRSLSHSAKRVRESPFWSMRPPHSVDLIPTWEPWQAPSLEAYLTKFTHEIRNLSA